MAMMNAVANRFFVAAVIVLTLTHWFHPFPIPSTPRLHPPRL